MITLAFRTTLEVGREEISSEESSDVEAFLKARHDMVLSDVDVLEMGFDPFLSKKMYLEILPFLNDRHIFICYIMCSGARNI